MRGFVIFNTKSFDIVYFVTVDYPSDADLYPINPDTESKLEIAPDHPAFANQDQYRIINGQLVRKNIVKVTADTRTFPADGTSQVQVTFDGVTGPTLIKVAGQDAIVSPSDDVLILTADAPRSFKVQVNDAEQWSEPLSVEAV